MSLEPTQDAWDGMLWEQEQPIAWLLSDDIVNLQPQQAQAQAQDPEETECDNDEQPAHRPLPVPMHTDDEGYDFDWSKSVPKYKLEAKAAREKNRVLKKTKKTTKDPQAVKLLFDLEKELRYKLIREEAQFQADLTHHRRDDCEFWQLLERQRKRREERVRRRILRSDVPNPLTIPVFVRPDPQCNSSV